MSALPFRTAADVDEAMPLIGRHLAFGGFLAYPTETVYGLGCRPVVADLNLLASSTARPDNKPFLLLVANREMVRDCGLLLTTAAETLATHFWPGPLTLVLGGGNQALPEDLRGPQGGIAVRWTSHPETGRMIKWLGAPITSTSANISGEKTLENVDSILNVFHDAAMSGQLLALDGGTLGAAPSSTIVDCSSSQPKIIREGAIPRSRIDACLKEASG